MDENMNQENSNQAGMQESQPEAPPMPENKPQSEMSPPQSGGETMVSGGSVGEYASFIQRAIAAIIDAVLVGFVIAILGMLFGGMFASSKSMMYAPPGIGNNPFLQGVGGLLSWAYYIFMDVKYGATLGKMAMKIRVQKEETGANLTWVQAFLREVIGKFISGVVLFIGYLWMLWDPKKQTWHDKIAGSVVVKKPM